MTMTMEQWHKAVDEWVERENARIGVVYRPSIGMYPPKQEGLIVSECGINNRIATADLIRHYADAIGDTNPLWRYEEYGRTTKYGGIIVLSDFQGESLFPLLVERLNVYTDPQRPLATTQGIYEINNPDANSPVLITSNFSLTYFIVSGEIEL